MGAAQYCRIMTSKDLLYVGIIVIATLVAYCHGYFSGFGRARRIYESVLGRSDPGQADSAPQKKVVVAGHPTGLGPSGLSLPAPRNRLSGQGLRGDFGNN
ncbi:MAG: hypothetical protein RJA22_1612 [Verrucomicrobiota bacterium]|jgi:hypothetical protein